MNNGKGDLPRHVNGEKYRSNYDQIFRKKDNNQPVHLQVENKSKRKEK